MSLKIFDIKATIKSKNNASTSWEKHNFIYKFSSNILYEKIIELKNNFENILLLTSDKNEALEKIKLLSFNNLTINSPYKSLHEKSSLNNINFISQPFEQLSLPKSKFDLIICHLSLHRINNVKNFIEKLFTLLDKGGLLVCLYFGGRSLNEFRQSLIFSDEKIRNGSFQRIIPFIDMIDASNIFQSVGFKEIVCDNSQLKVKYKKFSDLIHDIKGMGENNSLIDRNKGLMTKEFLKTTEFFYKKKFSDNKNNIIATCELISLVMWKN